MSTYKTADVFGMSRDIPLNYQYRDLADTVLIENLTRDKHLVIYGSSKQGKTCLRKHCLDDNDYVVVHCSNKWGLRELHTAILKSAGFEITLANTTSSSGERKIFAKGSIPFFGFGAEGGVEKSKSTENQNQTAPLELEPEDVNDIIRALQEVGFDRYIVLEDFHYLPLETQKDFSVALKAFHENSRICFIIVGVWLEENRLTVYNGDLTGRIISIDADKWNANELRSVIQKGEKLLNVSIAEDFMSELIERSSESVFIVQEACFLVCNQEDVYQTQPVARTIATDLSAREIVKEVVDKHTGRFNSFITQFADGFQATELEMYRWLLLPVLTLPIEELEAGIRLNEIRLILNNHHPKKDRLNPGNVTQALLSVSNLQVKKEIKPIVLDYDQTNLRLNVVDRSFLIWRENQNREDLLSIAGLPDETTSSGGSDSLFP